MSLKRKFLAQNLLLALGLAVAATASLWRLNALRREIGVSHFAYTELKTAETTMVYIARAQGLLAAPGADREQVLDNLRQAAAGLTEFVNGDKQYTNDEEAAGAYAVLVETAERAQGRLTNVIRVVEGSPAGAATTLSPAQIAEVDHAFWE